MIALQEHRNDACKFFAYCPSASCSWCIGREEPMTNCLEYLRDAYVVRFEAVKIMKIDIEALSAMMNDISELEFESVDSCISYLNHKYIQESTFDNNSMYHMLLIARRKEYKTIEEFLGYLRETFRYKMDASENMGIILSNLTEIIDYLYNVRTANGTVRDIRYKTEADYRI